MLQIEKPWLGALVTGAAVVVVVVEAVLVLLLLLVLSPQNPS